MFSLSWVSVGRDFDGTWRVDQAKSVCPVKPAPDSGNSLATNSNAYAASNKRAQHLPADDSGGDEALVHEL